MPLQATSGAASYDGFGGGVPFEPTYIEQVFATHLYTGNGSTQTITNGIDLSTKGGLVWMKARSSALSNFLCDTARGRAYYLYSDWNGAQQGPSASNRDLTSFNTDGFSLGQNANADINTNAVTFASWTFRKQPKFFDVVTWTGDGVAGRQIPHSLGSPPGCFFIKITNTTGVWSVWHRSLGSTGGFPDYMLLNLADAKYPGDASFVRSWDSTSFTVGAGGNFNASGNTYVAYIFAHDAGGFGLTGTDNVISCGSVATNGLNSYDINLGYEPQWLLIKNATAASNWYLADTMRGLPVGSAGRVLYPNTSGSEGNLNGISLNATGFNFDSQPFGSGTYIYIAIRRGPMKTPTTGTSVFTPATRTGTGSTVTTTAAGFPVDTYFVRRKNDASFPNDLMDRLRGSPSLVTNSTGIESTGNGQVTSWAAMSGVQLGGDGETNASSASYVDWYFRRAPGFFDVVCHTNQYSPIPHNLGVAPELMITKARNVGTGSASNWYVHRFNADGRGARLNSSDAWFNNYGPGSPVGTATTFETQIFSLSDNYITYLFASCPGVSKVGSYTGNGSSQTINCGFTGGARFVMVKRTDSTGNWMVVDTARGLVSASDPTLYLNSTAAEVTGVDWLDPDNSGFIVNQESTMNANVNGGTYIFLAIA